MKKACFPSSAKMPQLRTLYDEYQNRGVEVIGIKLDHNVESLRRFIEEHGCPWPQYFEEPDECSPGTAFTHRWGVHGIPAVYIIGQEGLLHAMDARGREESILLDWLDCDEET